MNIEQIKKDRNSGVMVTSATVNKLLDAALEMQQALVNIATIKNSSNHAEYAVAVVKRVEAL